MPKEKVKPPYSPKQADVLLNANARWNLMCGATRSGKTYVSYDLMLKRLLTQPAPRWIIGKTERTIVRNILDPMRNRFGAAYVSKIKGDGVCKIFGKEFYTVGANDEGSLRKIQGASMGYSYGDEVSTWPQSFFEMLKTRLDKPGAKFDGTCNPEGPYHWLKTTFIDKAENYNLKYWHFVLRMSEDI